MIDADAARDAALALELDPVPNQTDRQARVGSLDWRLRYLALLAPSTMAFRARTVGDALTDAAAHAADLRCRLREARAVAETEEAAAVLSEDFAALKNDPTRSKAWLTLVRADERGDWHQAEVVVDDLARQLAEAEVRIDDLGRRHRLALAELEAAVAELRFLAGGG